MKQIINRFSLLMAVILLSVTASLSQSKTNSITTTTKTKEMKTFVIEREMPGVGSLTAEQLKSASRNSCAVIKELGPSIEWVHSYVTGNKIFCIYKAENIEVIREHAKKAGLPANTITEVQTVISPKTAE